MFKKHLIFLIWSISAASLYALCLECSVLATDQDLCAILGESCTCALRYRQGVANQRQIRAGHDEQGSVI